MPSDFTVGIVDQSPMRRGETAGDALRDTVKMAQAAERFGYRRYWVAEHHSSGTLASTSPEILIGQILANTERIHVGSGGVMLTHYSALKVAEQFRVLDALYPGRVDLGIGRAPGSDQATMFALAYPKRPVAVDSFPQQVVDLVGYLHNALQADHPFAALRAAPGPKPESAPELWLLGSSDFSANLAAHLGLPFSFADFFGNTGGHGPAVCEIYRSNFQPSLLCPVPKVNIALQVLCADTQEEALHLASSRNLNRARRVLEAQGAEAVAGLIPADEAAAVKLSEEAVKQLEERRGGYIDGDPEQVKQGMIDAAARYDTNDLSIVTIAYRLEDRIRSLELVAEAFGLSRR